MTLIPDLCHQKLWRYAPDTVMTALGLSAVDRREFIPAAARKKGDCPIRPDLGVLALHCANGETRVFGFTEAKINSELRMVVKLSDFHLRDEVVRKWPVCQTI